MDKAGEQFWTAFWQEKGLPPPIRLTGFGPRVWFYRDFHRLWQAHLPPAGERPLRLLEIGCAQSRWLPYFAREWGYQVAGLDYSELGCAQSKALLAREGVEAEVYHMDMFHPDPRLLGAFDLVLSNGVVEHFADTAATLAQMAAFLKPGGLLLTIVPNFTGWLGRLQALVSEEFLKIHVPLARQSLAQAHCDAGLAVRACDYLAFLHFSVVNPGERWRDWRRTWFYKGMKLATGVSGTLKRLWPYFPLDRRTAGFVVCIAVKPLRNNKGE